MVIVQGGNPAEELHERARNESVGSRSMIGCTCECHQSTWDAFILATRIGTSSPLEVGARLANGTPRHFRKRPIGYGYR